MAFKYVLAAAVLASVSGEIELDLSFFKPWDHALPLWQVDESNHCHLSISTQMCLARRLWVLVNKN